MAKVLAVTVLMCICLILSILYKPNIKIKNLTLGTYWMVALLGAIILVALKCISFKEIGAGLTEDTSINPIKILVLFLSMTVQSIFLDEAGMFRYLANRTLRKAGNSQRRLFVYLYITVAVLTVFTSNDIIILTFTPFICYFAKNAHIDPIPFLFTEFVAANTWSMMLIIGNPTNVYLASANGIGFLEYTSVMALPTLIGGLTALLLLHLIFGKKLSKPMVKEEDSFQIEDKGLLVIGITHLALCTILLVISSYVGFEMWSVTLFFALSLFIISFIYLTAGKKKKTILLNSLKRMPWELIPFVISMFIFVLCINSVGLSEKIALLLNGKYVILFFGFASFLAANLVNNIPMSVLFSSVVTFLPADSLYSGVYAAIVGSNLGAFFTPVGALAGIMWTGILKKHDVEFKFSTYVKYGALVSLPTLLMTLLGLMLRL